MDFVIIANGEFLIREIIIEAIQDKIIIALDGAINKLSKLGIIPHIILGDFDSITPLDQKEWEIKASFADLGDTDQEYTNSKGIKIVPAKDQTQTDLAKALSYCNREQAKSITIICALGKRLDHHEDTLRSLMREYRSDRPIILHSDLQSIRFARDETMILRGEIGEKCGILAFPGGSFSSHGLKYEANNFPLHFAYSENICNELSANEVRLDISGSALIIMPPLLSSQRRFES